MEQLKLFKDEEDGDKDELQLARALFNANGNIFVVAKRLNIPINDLTEKIKNSDKVRTAKKTGERKILDRLRYACFEQLYDFIKGYRTIKDGEDEIIPPAIQLQAIKLGLVELPKLKNDTGLGRARIKELERRGSDDEGNPELEALVAKTMNKIREGG